MLKSTVAAKLPIFAGYNQQDAQEFLRFILDSLHEVCTSACLAHSQVVTMCLWMRGQGLILVRSAMQH